MSESASGDTTPTLETVTVQVWNRSLAADYDDMETDAPDAEIELPLWDGSEIWSEKYEHILADSIHNHRKYGFHIKGIDEMDAGVKLKVFTNDSPHTPNEWGRPIEAGGIKFLPNRTDVPFQTEMWGRIKLEVERV